ncbi:hypothetical protein JB92DRAFT_3092712 [Gautieria morchelliformis]|nr:hypothetical protein JB92DRAFT_3092712 [Gautieria morchelliformis]
MGTAWLGLKAVALAWLALALACKILSQAVGTWPGSAPAWPWLGPWPVGGEWIVDTDINFFRSEIQYEGLNDVLPQCLHGVKLLRETLHDSSYFHENNKTRNIGEFLRLRKT